METAIERVDITVVKIGGIDNLVAVTVSADCEACVQREEVWANRPIDPAPEEQ